MDKVISEKIATKIIFSLFTESMGWVIDHGEEGEFVTNGEIKILSDAHEVFVKGKTESGEPFWKALLLNETDILRIHDVAYDICNDHNWRIAYADPVVRALRVLDIL